MDQTTRRKGKSGAKFRKSKNASKAKRKRKQTIAAVSAVDESLPKKAGKIFTEEADEDQLAAVEIVLRQSYRTTHPGQLAHSSDSPNPVVPSNCACSTCGHQYEINAAMLGGIFGTSPTERALQGLSLPTFPDPPFLTKLAGGHGSMPQVKP